MRYYILFLLFTATAFAQAQNYAEEGFRYTQFQYLGTARSAGAGGAMGAVGADPGAVVQNPAGLGLYRSSEFCISPGMRFGRSNSAYLGEEQSTDFNRFSLEQASLVWVRPMRARTNAFSLRSSRLRSLSFGISYQQLAQWKQESTFDGLNFGSSLAQTLTDQVNQSGKEILPENYPIETFLAYYAYLINYDSSQMAYTSPVSLPVNQNGRIQQAGSMNELQVSMGFNYSDQWYFGLALGVPFLTYNRQYRFEESSDSSNRDFQRYALQTTYRSAAAGFNLKLGIIYKPFSWWRLGLSLRTPDVLSMEENYSASVSSSVFDTLFQTEASYEPFRFQFRSPIRGTLSQAFFIQQSAFISLDYEFYNPGRLRYDFPSRYDTQESQVRTAVRESYTFVHQIRLGAEYAWKSLRLRAGGSWSGSPLKKEIRREFMDNGFWTVSAGAGYRGKRFFIDAAYIFQQSQERFTPYVPYRAEQIEQRSVFSRHMLMISAGMRFGRNR